MEEVTCDIVPYTDCKMTWENVDYNDTEEFIETWTKFSCDYDEILMKHTKTMPVCRNETKLDCISDWKIDSNGNKVYLVDTTIGY